jgi:hypothetical protein
MRHPGNDIAIDPAVAVEQVPRGERHASAHFYEINIRPVNRT